MRLIERQGQLLFILLSSTLALSACSKDRAPSTSPEPEVPEPQQPEPEVPGPEEPEPEVPGPEEPEPFCLTAQDGSPCEVNLECAADGDCEDGLCPAGTIDCSLFDISCFGGTCNDGECVAHALSEISCDSGDECVADTMCDSGVCQGGVSICTLGRDPQCIREDCDSERCTYSNVADGTSCQLSPECTEDYSCIAGMCEPETDALCVPDTSLLTEYMGGAGGSYFGFNCPSNSVLVSVGANYATNYWYGALVEVRAECQELVVVDGELTFSSNRQNIVTELIGSYYLNESGPEMSCSGNSAFTALSASPGVVEGTALVSGMEGHCSTLSLEDDRLVLSDEVTITPVLSRTNAERIKMSCPSGSIATGLAGRSGEVLDGIRLHCRPLNEFEL